MSDAADAAIEETFHTPARFAIMASLVDVDRAEFALVRDAIGVSDSVLSKHASHLERAGFVEVVKGYVGKRPRTWFALTDDGRTAFRRHLAALRRIADAAADYTAAGRRES
ncbi:transcriptional regulator [Nocardioides zeae]|uniref:Transcriptional regulator n=1 Tax=Nocardioides imazamoxiresistens TaxID=3231893 RepID=A0ABU3Q1X0_9ACTN|nr:transcriptional regulator [Nocardioides zeae]MDT9595339.1 transcriptional regulator [Nocardioides zeae]